MKEDTSFSNNPLKILLPDIGELSHLRNSLEVFQARFLEVRAEKELRISNQDEDEDEQFDAEEQMLIQVLQWLSVGEQN